MHQETKLGAVTVEATRDASDRGVVGQHCDTPSVLVTGVPAAGRTLDGSPCLVDAR